MKLPIFVEPILRQLPTRDLHLENHLESSAAGQMIIPACCQEICVPTPLGSVCTCAIGGCD